jgi:hypothetical protein
MTDRVVRKLRVKFLRRVAGNWLAHGDGGWVLVSGKGKTRRRGWGISLGKRNDDIEDDDRDG